MTDKGAKERMQVITAGLRIRRQTTKKKKTFRKFATMSNVFAISK